MKEIIQGILDADIECLEDVLWEMATNEFEPDEAAKYLRIDLQKVMDDEEKARLLDSFFIGIFGWSFETLLKRVQKEEEGGESGIEFYKNGDWIQEVY